MRKGNTTHGKSTVELEMWTEIIKPKSSLFNFHFKETWRYRDLILLFVKRDIASQYRQTILGPLWHVVQPLLTTFMFLILFNKIANISTDTLPPVLFYMSSITIWTYFSTCLTSTSNTFVTNAAIFGKVYFPRLAMPLATVCSNLFKFSIQFILLLVMIVYYILIGDYTLTLGWHTLLLPVIILMMGAMGLGLGITISSLTTKYRDLAILVGFGVGLFMYITPVAYPLSYLNASKYKVFIEWNPLTPLVEGFRYALFGQGTFNGISFLYSFGCTIFFLLCGVLIFNKVERSFMDTV
ncbi:MAG: ABC transporter permease [Bacteroidetes bacterium]|nr:ABC transporter permease [Bacteroidota bacterium]